ncbi:MAG: hypothetical protein PHS92_05430 [Candidatus Gracilibacteria bacterium]|nr:hypothetical protein [Candidatus Gracilibacteria bacterium]
MKNIWYYLNITLSIGILLVIITYAASSCSGGICRVDTSTNLVINGPAPTGCKKITNNNGNPIMVPISTVGQWDAFLAAMPSGVTSSSCSASCTVSVQYSCGAATISFPGYYGASLLVPVGNVAADGASILNYPYDCNCDSCGENCSTCYDTMQCVNGVAIYNGVTSCTPVLPCTLPWGGTINHGTSVGAYSTNSSATCTSFYQTRTCNNGVLSGSYTYQTCTDPNPCSCNWGEDWGYYDCNEDGGIFGSTNQFECQRIYNLPAGCNYDDIGTGDYRFIYNYSDNGNCSGYSYPLYVDRGLAEGYYVILSSNGHYPLGCNTAGLLNADTHCIAGFPNTDGLSTIYMSPYSKAGQSFTSLGGLDGWYMSPTLDAAMPYLSKIKYDAAWYYITNGPSGEDSRYLPSGEFDWGQATTWRLINKQ